MTIDEIKRQIFIDSEEVCGNTMIDIYQAEEYVEQAYNKAIDDLQNELKNHYTEYIIDCVLADTGFYSYTTAYNYLEDYIDKIAEKLKRGGENESSN